MSYLDRGTALSDLHQVARILRRGRPVATVAEEAGVAPSVWTRIEEGRHVSLWSLLRVVAYMGHSLVIRPEDTAYGAGRLEDAPDLAVVAPEPEEELVGDAVEVDYLKDDEPMTTGELDGLD